MGYEGVWGGYGGYVGKVGFVYIYLWVFYVPSCPPYPLRLKIFNEINGLPNFLASPCLPL